MKPELLIKGPFTVGEGPLWHPDEQCLYWVDIFEGRLYRYDPANQADPQGQGYELVFEGPCIGGFTIQENGQLLLFMAKGAVAILREGKLDPIIDEIPEERDGSFNDVIADPAGRVYAGTFSTEAHKGRLYRLDTDGTLTKLLEGIGCSNGMGFTPDRQGMYYTDSVAGSIYYFDYDKATGELSHQRVFVQTADGIGGPDGMTVDAEGCVWSALWDGECIARYAPDGSELLRIPISVPQVACPTFGGPDYRTLYITTAGRGISLEDYPRAGSIFTLEPGVRGVPEFRSRIGLDV
jgi:D-xylonolactonase